MRSPAMPVGRQALPHQIAQRRLVVGAVLHQQLGVRHAVQDACPKRDRLVGNFGDAVEHAECDAAIC